MIDILREFFQTKLGKIVGTVALILILILVTIGTFLVTSENNKNRKREESTTEKVTEVMATETESESHTETTTEETTTILETTTEETTVEETTEEPTTEEVTTVPEVIPMEDLDIKDGDELGEDAGGGRQDEVEPDVEPEVETDPPTETTTTKKEQTTTSPKEEETTDSTNQEVVIPDDVFDETLMSFNKLVTAPSPSTNEYGCIAKGIDVSKHQGTIDWAKVKAAGYTFAIIRCGYRGYETGALATDSRFVENIEGALANGMQVGIYFFSQAITVKEAQEEASMVIGLIKDYDITYPVVFDWETSPGYRTYKDISTSTMTSIVNTYLSMVENAGYKGMVYGNKGDLSRFDYASISKKYKVWFARYTSMYQYADRYFQVGDSTPETICSYQMWQYKSTGSVPGISTNVDMNVAFFSYEGSGVKKAPLRIELTNTDIEIRPGTNINLLKCVKAYDSTAYDVTANVTYEIFDSSGNIVSKSVAVNTKGTYKVVYYINDFTGVGATAEATLVVDGSPTIALTKTYLTWLMDMECADETVTDMSAALEVRLQEILASNVESATDLEGNDISASVEIVAPTDFSFDSLTIGTYLFTYKVKDNSGIESEEVFTLELATLASERLEITYNELMKDEDESDTVENGSETTDGWDYEAFEKELLNYLFDNVVAENPTGIGVKIDDELLAAIEADSVEVGKEYKVRYAMADLDTSLYYKECIVIFNEWR